MSPFATTLTLLVFLVAVTTVKSTRKIITVNDSCTCGIENDSENTINVAKRIIRGDRVPTGKYPWMVYIEAKGRICSGAIINDKEIITAASCLAGINSPSDIFVYHVQGNGNKLSSFPRLNVTSIQTKNLSTKTKTGQAYESVTTHYDIAILELEERLTFSDTFSPICINPLLFQYSWGDWVNPKIAKMSFFAAGPPSVRVDGSHYQPDQDRSLSEVPLRFVSRKDCEKYHPGTTKTCFKGMKERRLLFNKTKSGLCVGDDGGPLMTRENGRVSMVAIASMSGCLLNHKPSKFESIEENLFWLVEQLSPNAKWCKGSPFIEWAEKGLREDKYEFKHV